VPAGGWRATLPQLNRGIGIRVGTRSHVGSHVGSRGCHGVALGGRRQHRAQRQHAVAIGLDHHPAA